MDTEKSRKFYQKRYDRAIEQFGENSLTAKICKKKLALLDAIVPQPDDTKDSLPDEHHSEKNTAIKSDVETDELS